MTLRKRLALATTGAVVTAVAAASIFTYLATRSELQSQFDATLRDRATEVTGAAGVKLRSGLAGAPELSAVPPPPFGGPGGFIQTVNVLGQVTLARGEVRALPVTERVRRVAAGQAGTFLADTVVDGRQVRVLTLRWLPGVVLQVARPLSELNTTLTHLRWVLLGAVLIGIVAAVGLGLLVGRPVLDPVRRLTKAAERVAGTLDLSRRIDAGGTGELSRLAASFNAMLAALDHARRAQARLVADASHELRTPLTSLCTNIELFLRRDDLSAEDRRRLLLDVDRQIVGVSDMVGGLIDLARGEEPQAAFEPVRLDELAAGAIEQAERHWPEVRFVADLHPTSVWGAPVPIQRAVGNLLDNAGKWSAPGGRVAVSVQSGSVTVRDHGPGIASADLPFIWERFWRAPTARDRRGSGLGLAIVRQVADTHGAEATVENEVGGGATFRLRFGGTTSRVSPAIQVAASSS